MEKKKISWLKRSLLIPAALLGALAFGGCKSTSALDEPSFLRQYSKPTAAAKAESRAEGKEAAEPSEPGKNYPLKVYLSGRGTFAEDFARGSGSAKIVISPTQKIRIPAYFSGSYSESEQNDGDTLTTRTVRGGIGVGVYHDLSEDVTGYAEGTAVAEGTGYKNERDNLDLDRTLCFGVGKLGLIVKSLDLKLLLSGGFGKGEYSGTLGTADLDDIATRGFISLKGKMKITGKGGIMDFDSEDEESSEDREEKKGQGVYALAGVGYDQQEFKNIVKGRIPSVELGGEWRDEIKGMPYFVRVLLTGRQEEYLYPFAKDKKEIYFGIGVDAGIKLGDCLTLTLGTGYDGQQHCYGTAGFQFSFGMKPKKK